MGLLGGMKPGHIYKAIAALTSFSLLLAACSVGGNAASNQIPTPEATAPAPTEVPPSPTAAPTIPEAILRQEAILARAGYDAQVVGNEVHLVNRFSEPVLTSIEASTITIRTEDGETLSFPAESFEVRSTLAVGLEIVLTVKDGEGNPQYFYLEKTQLWATPLELQTDPRDIAQYTEVDLEDVWSGRVLTSVALEAESFPEGTLVPDGFAYMLWQGGIEKVMIQDFVGGSLDTEKGYYEQVRYYNDYRRYVAFFQSETPEGVPVILGTEQVLMPDSKASVFFIYVFGQDWSWVEDGGRLTRIYNVVNSLFQASSLENDRGTYFPAVIRPVITWDRDLDEYTGVFGNRDELKSESTGAQLYLSQPQNNPLSLRPDLQGLIEQALASPQGQIDYLLPVGREIKDIQYMVLIGTLGPGMTQRYLRNP